jgi:processive 1,2-diacylglycerol beta-glucosyltransferase
MRAAEAVQLALAARRPDVSIRHVDILTLATPAFRRLYGQGYVDFVNSAPEVVGAIFDRTNRNPQHPAARKLGGAVQRSQLKGFEALVIEDQPDLVVHTHFLPAEICERLRKKGKWKGPHAVVVTDYDVHRFWHCPGIDRYFVARGENVEVLSRLGAARDSVSVTGIPIHPSFATSADLKSLRAKHAVSSDRPLVLVLSGGFGVGPVAELAESLAQVLTSSRLVVVAGRNEALKARITKATAAFKDRVRVIGFTTEMREWMALASLIVTKPGGLTSSEALACGVPMVITFPIPGQETRNATMLYEEGAAISGENPSTVAWRVEKLLENPGRLAAMKQNAERLGRPNAAFDVADQALTLLKRSRPSPP